MLLACTAATASCSGGLGHRSVARVDGAIEIPDGVRSVRIEVVDGSLEVLAADKAAPRALRYEGLLRRGADTADGLAALERVVPDLVAVPDPAAPEVLVVRAPTRPAGLEERSVLGIELIVRMPAELGLTVAVAGSGHLTVEGRRGPVELDTKRGDLRVTGCTRGARIRTGTGMTIVYDHRGDLEVDARVGDMQVFMREAADRIRLVTGRGNLQCLVPADTGFRLDARAETGKVTNGFGIPLRRTGYTSSMVGGRGDGRTEIVMRTGSGSLSLSVKEWE